VDLRRHTDDPAFRLPGQYASWPLGGPAAMMLCRGFRLVLTGPTASAVAPWNLCLSNFEFYGLFCRVPEATVPPPPPSPTTATTSPAAAAAAVTAGGVEPAATAGGAEQPAAAVAAPAEGGPVAAAGGTSAAAAG